MKRISIAAVLVSTVFALGALAQTPTAPRGGAPAQTPPRPTTPAPTTPAPQTPPAQTPPAQTPPAQPAPQAARPATPPPVFPAGAKIGFVNMQLVVTESKLGKAGQDRMKKLRDENQAKLAPLAKAIQDQQQKINTQTGVVNDAAMQALRRELDRMQLDAQTEQQRAQSAEQNLNEDLLNDFSQKAMPIIDALRVEKDLWFILGVQDTTEGGGQLIVASANPGLDVSLEIVKRLDAKFAGTDVK